MPGDWVDGNYAWGEHTDGFWNDALNIARAEGWEYRTLSSHRVGEVRCPADVHSQKIDSTSKWSETKSQDLVKLVRQTCQHSERTTTALGEARRLIDVAQALVEQAQEALDRVFAARGAETALAEAERLEMLLDTADANVDAISARRDELLAEAVSGPDDPGAELVLDRAEQARERSAEARRNLNTLDLTVRKAMVAETRAVDRRVVDIKSQLS